MIEGPASHLYLSADGSRLAILAWTQPKGGRGPWRVWDTQDGRVVHELFGDRPVRHFEVSPDRRHLAAMLSDDDLRQFFTEARDEVRAEKRAKRPQGPVAE